MERKLDMDLWQPSQSIYPDGEFWIVQSLVVLKWRSWVYWFICCTTTGRMKHCPPARWRRALCTIMVLSYQFWSSIACHLWITYTCIPSCSSYNYYKIQYCRNSTLAMDEVGCLAVQAELIVALLEGLVLLVDISGVAKNILENLGFGFQAVLE